MRTAKELKEQAEKYRNKLEKIKVCAFDVDGILTNGMVWWAGEEIGWNRTANVHDGYGMLILKRAGLKVGIITGGDSLSVVKRFKDNLKLDFLFKGNEDKRGAFQEILDMGYKAEEVLYMGDEFFDIPVLKAAGFSATVPGASAEVQDEVDYITSRASGMGCAREVIDMLRFCQNIVPTEFNDDNAGKIS